ncbi:hypothetical protein [Bradyrhizobium sp. 138]|nr:hypothetical protein [Bradyrhizobium sp. 138]
MVASSLAERPKSGAGKRRERPPFLEFHDSDQTRIPDGIAS